MSEEISSQPSASELTSSSVIKDTVGDVTPEELDIYKGYKGLENYRFKLETVLEIWQKQEEQDRNLRKIVAYAIFGGLGVELIIGNLIMILMGFGKIKIEQWVANIFFVGMYTQIVTLVTVVVKNLFPTPQKDGNNLLKEIVKDL